MQVRAIYKLVAVLLLRTVAGMSRGTNTLQYGASTLIATAVAESRHSHERGVGSYGRSCGRVMSKQRSSVRHMITQFRYGVYGIIYTLS